MTVNDYIKTKVATLILYGRDWNSSGPLPGYRNKAISWKSDIFHFLLGVTFPGNHV